MRPSAKTRSCGEKNFWILLLLPYTSFAAIGMPSKNPSERDFGPFSRGRTWTGDCKFLIRMWGIIPAAGKGSRIQPLAFSKELLPVGSRLDPGGCERPRAVSEYL